jgi:hypothetical protein
MKHFVVAIMTSTVLTFALTVPAHAITYGGDATGAEVTVTATGTTIRAATGTLAIAGGMADAALSVGDIPGSATGGAVVLTASALHSSVIGGRGVTRAEASMGAIGLTVSGNTFSADFLMARSTASCNAGSPVLTGNSELTNLVINGNTITVSGSPNQTVSLPNGTAIINAQVSSVNGTAGELAVTALRVMTHDTITQQPIADVLLTTVDAKIDCQGSSSSTDEWVTGGGWIVGQSGSGKATFGFVAGKLDAEGNPQGHLTFKDHDANVTVHGTVIVTFAVCVGAGPASFVGTDSNGDEFTVEVKDIAEPGGGSDTFSIVLRDQNSQIIYSNTGQTLSKGNIQAHGFTCS